MAPVLLWSTSFENLPPPKRGKVRDIYDLGEHLLIVACDRVSAFDRILSPGIPGKGLILNQLTNFWMSNLSSIVGNHLVATQVEDFPPNLKPHHDQLRGRSVLVRKAAVIPFECVARGYLAGSAYHEYTQHGTANGQPLPAGLERASKLSETIFTPATKAESGHDTNVGFDALETELGPKLAGRLRTLTLDLFDAGSAHSRERGLLLADTKFEFGVIEGKVRLIDEVLTPDSSRFWSAEQWTPGIEPISVDKQFIRDWLDSIGWDRESPPPELPEEIVVGTLERYVAAFRKITSSDPEM
ncbi:MAG: phosphoribosylaminoimidazolesuccinocarboxamide synthase [Thermoanaerobaculia bacterium]